LLKIELIYSWDEYWYIWCELDGNRVKHITMEGFAKGGDEDEEPYLELSQSDVKRYLMQIPDKMFDRVVRFMKKFLRAYKVARIALSYMNL